MSRSTFERFAQLAQSSARCVVPVWSEMLFDSDTAVSAFAKIRRGPFGFLLESAPAGSDSWARYSFLGTEPRRAWRFSGGVVEDWTEALGWHSARTPADPLSDLDSQLTATEFAAVPELGEFWNGAVGYLGYDIVRLIEDLPAESRKAGPLPEAMFVFTRSMVIVDNLHSRARIVIAVETAPQMSSADLRQLYDEAVSEIEEIVSRLEAPASLSQLSLDPAAVPATGRSSLSRDDFISGVERIKEYIRAGDCFQALLSRRIETEHDFDSSSLYRALRALNPSPYMFHLFMDGVELVGSSPELLVRMEDDRVTVRPIAGTRPRGENAARDAELSAELLADPKERAEHVMLVDLGRNDVGRVARYGTVEVTEFMQVEKYSHVLHIVSQVQGRPRDDVKWTDVLRATFPAGTMTGAPKVRAMEIIDELEPVSRGAYAGATGYIAGGAKRMDLAITIRTCVIADGIASVQAGAGIVADSVPESEWKETENKARALLTAIAQARA